MTKHLTLLTLFLFSYTVAQIGDESKFKIIHKQYENKVNESRLMVEDLIEEKNIPGLSIVVANKDAILWSESFGYADLENNILVSPDTKFRIGSISKSLTSLALGKLIEEGRIQLSDTVQKYVHYFPRKTYPISIREIATHTSGIRHYNYRNGEFFSDEYYGTVEESVNIFKEDSLLFKPSTKYHYTTYGYVLLSAVIEEATGQSYLKYMQDSVLKPLGMMNTVPDLNDQIIQNRARFYQLNDSTIVNASYIDNSNKWAGGGYISTSMDLAKMSQKLLKGEYLKNSTLKSLWTPTVLANQEEINYCIGWRKDKDESGRTYIHHGGSSVGGRSFLLIYPDEEVIVVINSNLFARFNDSFVLEIADKFTE